MGLGKLKYSNIVRNRSMAKAFARLTIGVLTTNDSHKKYTLVNNLARSCEASLACRDDSFLQ